MNEFEKCWDEHDKYDWQRDEQYETAKKFFLAGASAMREKCVEVAENEANGFRNTRIAAAIRKIGVK